MDKEFEMKQIKAAVDAIMNHFGRYVVDCDKHWPVCFRDGEEMCQVIPRGTNSYFQCFKCGHKEWSI